MAEIALAALAAGGAGYSAVTQSKQAKAMKRQLAEERERVTKVEEAQKRVRTGGRGMLAFVDEALGDTMGGAVDDRQGRLFGAGGG